MTFKLELSDNAIFKTVFDSIASIIDEVTIVFDSEGMRLNALDRSHITFITLELAPEVFDSYICDTPEKVTVDCDRFNKILKKCKTNDIIQLTMDEGNFIIIFEGDATRRFKIRVIDTEYEAQVPPNINHTVYIKVPSSMMQDALNDMLIFSDKLRLLIDENYLKIISEGEFGDVDIKYLHGENVLEVAQSIYSIEKLKDIFKASKFSKECEVGLGNDMPVVITFELPTRDGVLRYLLAPRLEERG